MHPIHLACQEGTIESVKVLLEHKCNIDASDNEGMQPIHYACLNDNIKLVKLLLKHKCNIEANDYKGIQPIHIACQNDNIEIIKLLLEHKCNIDASNKNGKQPIHYACLNDKIEIVKLLLEHKCNINASNKFGMHPIHYACQNGNIELVKLLLEHKCDIDASDYFGMHPIHYACQNGNIELVKLLLEHKCDIEDCYDDLVKMNKVVKSPPIIDLLTAYRKNKSMCSIGLAMSLKCESGCSHISCFMSLSVDDLKKLNERIGEGAHGKVYKCSQSQHTFAMKIIKIKDDTKSIEKEIYKYRNILKHVNIVSYFGAITESYRMAIFMEYMDGESLYNRIKEHGSLPHNSIENYSRQIILGIAFMHQKKIIHRDIKSANILLDSSGESLKLCDLGISRSLSTMSTISTQKAVTICGTPNYMAPEVIKSEPYSFPADIWSIGATVVEMLTGFPPFNDMHQYAVINKLNQMQKFEFTSVEPMSDHLKSFVDHMLQCEPSNRATANQLLEYQFINTDNKYTISKE